MDQDGNNRVTDWWQVPALLLLTVAMLYGHTLNVPFYLDDTLVLVNNYRLRDLPATFANLFTQRGLVNLTFALNYRFTGWSLPPLHLISIVLHLSCALLAWRLLCRLLGGRWLPLLGALFFVAHPLQTQAVTYVVQRATLLGALFWLLAILCHLRVRDALAAGQPRSSPAWLRPYLGSLLAGACAVLAKENAATLPLLLIAHDRLFPLSVARTPRQLLADYLPYFAVPLLFGLSIAAALAGTGEAAALHSPLASLQHSSPLGYLFTQFQVIWAYLRLLFLPYGQLLEYNYQVPAQWFTWQSLLGLAGLLLFGWLTWRIRRHRPLLAFGVVWFFLALAVESSVIPLDPLFEHRLYLPMFGLVLVLLDGLPALLGERRTLLALGVALLACAPLTWQRNALWRDPIAFYEDNLRRVPDSERAIKTLALLYKKGGREREALRLLADGVAANPESFYLYGSLARRLAEQGELQAAIDLLERGMKRRPVYADLYEAAASICRDRGDFRRAADYLLRGIAVPGAEKGRLLNTLGVLYSDADADAAAEQTFFDSLTQPTGDIHRAVVYLNLARDYYYRENWPKAFAALQQVLQLTPGDPVALERLGDVALRLNDLATAEVAAAKLEHADPEGWQRLRMAIGQVRNAPR